MSEAETLAGTLSKKQIGTVSGLLSWYREFSGNSSARTLGAQMIGFKGEQIWRLPSHAATSVPVRVPHKLREILRARNSYYTVALSEHAKLSWTIPGIHIILSNPVPLLVLVSPKLISWDLHGAPPHVSRPPWGLLCTSTPNLTPSSPLLRTEDFTLYSFDVSCKTPFCIMPCHNYWFPLLCFSHEVLVWRQDYVISSVYFQCPAERLKGMLDVL